MPITIEDGGLEVKDPAEQRVFLFDWDAKNLGAGVQITASTFVISVVSGDNATPLTKDNESIVTGSRKTQLRLRQGTLGTLYQIDNEITTNETPAQIKNRYFRVLVEDR